MGGRRYRLHRKMCCLSRTDALSQCFFKLEHVWDILNGFIHLKVRCIYSIQKTGVRALDFEILKSHIMLRLKEANLSLNLLTLKRRKQQPGVIK